MWIFDWLWPVLLVGLSVGVWVLCERDRKREEEARLQELAQKMWGGGLFPEQVTPGPWADSMPLRVYS